MMRDERFHQAAHPDPAPGPSEAFGPPGTRLLIVEAARLLPSALIEANARSVVITRLSSIDRQFIDRVAPDVIVAPLFGAGFDILDLVARLATTGFRGRVLAISGPLPDPAAVAGEIRSAAKGLRIDLIELESDAYSASSTTTRSRTAAPRA